MTVAAYHIFKYLPNIVVSYLGDGGRHHHSTFLAKSYNYASSFIFPTEPLPQSESEPQGIASSGLN